MRRAIAETMTLSAQTPQFTLTRSFAVAAVDRARAQAPGISYEDLIVAACARALRLHPDLNASWAQNEIIAHPRVNVGVAMAIPGGLVSPAILDADRRTPTEIRLERRRLRTAAESGRLRGEELFGATFSISNLGPLGVEQFQALVIPPQAAILAVGAVVESHDRRINLALSCDHRVVDGAPAAMFLGSVIDLLDAPERLAA
jgi:pyruvate dehydrogenase E2 component (dihydrolipoamide acetyltransferase)